MRWLKSVRIQHSCHFELENLLELVGEGLPDVIIVRLEGHSEKTDLFTFETSYFPGELRNHHIGKSFVDQHRGVPEKELIIIEGGELHRVFEEAWASRETRTWKFFGSRIVISERFEDTVEIDSGTFGNHVELVGDCKMQISPGVRHKFREFRFLRSEADDLG